MEREYAPRTRVIIPCRDQREESQGRLLRGRRRQRKSVWYFSGNRV